MTTTSDLAERILLTPKQVLGRRIREARQGADLSHDRLGILAGTSRQHLIKLEQGQHRPRAEMLLKIAEATEREVEWFLRPDRSPAKPFRAVA